MGIASLFFPAARYSSSIFHSMGRPWQSRFHGEFGFWQENGIAVTVGWFGLIVHGALNPKTV